MKYLEYTFKANVRHRRPLQLYVKKENASKEKFENTEDWVTYYSHLNPIVFVRPRFRIIPYSRIHPLPTSMQYFIVHGRGASLSQGPVEFRRTRVAGAAEVVLRLYGYSEANAF